MSFFAGGQLDTQRLVSDTLVVGNPRGGVASGFDVWLLLGDEGMTGPMYTYGANAPSDIDVYTLSQRDLPTRTYGNFDHVYPDTWSFRNSVASDFATMYMPAPGRQVMFVPCACWASGFFADLGPASTVTTRAGRTLWRTWRADVSGGLLDEAIRRANIAMRYDANLAADQRLGRNANNVFKGVLWQHGASDKGIDAQAYASHMRAMIARLRSEVDGAQDSVFLAGGPFPYQRSAVTDAVLEALSTLGGTVAKYAYADSRGEFPIPLTDTVVETNMLASRYYTAYLKSAGGPPPVTNVRFQYNRDTAETRIDWDVPPGTVCTQVERANLQAVPFATRATTLTVPWQLASNSLCSLFARDSGGFYSVPKTFAVQTYYTIATNLDGGEPEPDGAALLLVPSDAPGCQVSATVEVSGTRLTLTFDRDCAFIDVTFAPASAPNESVKLVVQDGTVLVSPSLKPSTEYTVSYQARTGMQRGFINTQAATTGDGIVMTLSGATFGATDDTGRVELTDYENGAIVEDPVRGSVISIAADAQIATNLTLPLEFTVATWFLIDPFVPDSANPFVLNQLFVLLASYAYESEPLAWALGCYTPEWDPTAWTHIAVTANADRVVLYVNGDFKSALPGALPWNYRQLPLKLQGAVKLSDLRVYDYVMSAPEVAALAEA